MERPPWATTLTSDSIVTVSQSADHAVQANLAAVSPGRYLCVPGLAYRLALAAAGDAEVGTSLYRSCKPWDFAASAALLRGTGGEIVDGSGTAITRIGGNSVNRVFGGSPSLVREIARRYKTTHLAKDPHSELGILSWPPPPAIVTDDGLLERAQGCWLGQLTGDALGSRVEFRSASDLKRRYPHGLREIGPSQVFGAPTLAGQPTDDSEMALALARTVLHERRYEASAVAQAYRRWLQSNPFDCGVTIGAALRAVNAAAPEGSIAVGTGHGAANAASQANGALMRQSPLAIWGYALHSEALDRQVREDTRLTHPSPVCQDASAAFIVALTATIQEGLGASEAYQCARDWQRDHGSCEPVTEALQAASHMLPDFSQHQGWVLVALQNAFYQALHAGSVEEGVVASVMGGGDTDTNAAVAGALLGAIHGARAIPQQWRQTVLTCRPQKDAPGIAQPRPRAFWPVDALYLAERLLMAGQQAAMS